MSATPVAATASADSPATCLRCGSFMPPEPRALEGLDLCAGCLKEAPLEPKMMVVVLPPRRVLLARLAVVYAVLFPMIGLGALFGYVAIAPLLQITLNPLMLPAARAGGAALGAILAGLAANVANFVFLMPLIVRIGRRAHKAKILEKVGLGTDPSDPRFEMAIFAPERLSYFRFRMKLDVGVIADAPGGLAFIGVRGTRLAIRREEVAAASVERMKMLPPWRGVRIDLNDGTSRWFAVTESGSYGGARRRAEEIAARLGRP